MIEEILSSLTADQKAELELLGITRQRRSNWKTGQRMPTAAQLVVLATIAKRDPMPLLYWLAEQEANPAQQALFRRAKETGKWAALTVILTAALARPDPAFSSVSIDENPDQQRSDRLHIVDKV